MEKNQTDMKIFSRREKTTSIQVDGGTMFSIENRRLPNKVLEIESDVEFSTSARIIALIAYYFSSSSGDRSTMDVSMYKNENSSGIVFSPLEYMDRFNISLLIDAIGNLAPNRSVFLSIESITFNKTFNVSKNKIYKNAVVFSILQGAEHSQSVTRKIIDPKGKRRNMTITTGVFNDYLERMIRPPDVTIIPPETEFFVDGNDKDIIYTAFSILHKIHNFKGKQIIEVTFARLNGETQEGVRCYTFKPCPPVLDLVIFSPIVFKALERKLFAEVFIKNQAQYNIIVVHISTDKIPQAAPVAKKTKTD